MSTDANSFRERLLEVARAEAAARGWPWLEPVEVRVESTDDDGRVWTVRTNAGGRGRNARFAVREVDLKVVSAGYLPR